MSEIKQEVRPIEVNYECDACGKGMMSATQPRDSATGKILHRCLICNHEQSFQRQYPSIEYVELDEKI